MDAAEGLTTDDPAIDRTVAALLEPGPEVDGRSVRPARVSGHRLQSPETSNGAPGGGERRSS
jgi:molecular chaperone GrpE